MAYINLIQAGKYDANSTPSYTQMTTATNNHIPIH